MLEYSHNHISQELTLLRAPIFDELAKHLPPPPTALLDQLQKQRGLLPTTVSDYIRILPSTEDNLKTLLRSLGDHFHERELHTAGFSLTDGGEDAPHIGAVYRCYRHNLASIVFLYRNSDRSVHYIRPHKVHVDSQELSLFETDVNRGMAPVLVISEGEFKALASAQLGYQTIALNGLQSFTGRHFPKLIECIDERKPETVVLVLDHEYKPKWREEPDETGPILTFKLGLRLQEADVNVRIGLLPRKFASENAEGWKVDIDGALAKGMTKVDYDAVINDALPPLDYIDAVCPEIQEELKKHIIYIPSPLVLEKLHAGK